MLIAYLKSTILGHGRLPQASSVAGGRRACGPLQGCDRQAAERAEPDLASVRLTRDNCGKMVYGLLRKMGGK